MQTLSIVGTPLIVRFCSSKRQLQCMLVEVVVVGCRGCFYKQDWSKRVNNKRMLWHISRRTHRLRRDVQLKHWGFSTRTAQALYVYPVINFKMMTTRQEVGLQCSATKFLECKWHPIHWGLRTLILMTSRAWSEWCCHVTPWTMVWQASRWRHVPCDRSVECIYSYRGKYRYIVEGI